MADFDFDSFNKATKEAGAGLKLFLAEQLLSDALSVMTKFRNPLRKDLEDIVDELSSLRKESKKQAANRLKAGNAENVPEPTKTVQETIAAAAQY
jgi:hypothetical protein